MPGLVDLPAELIEAIFDELEELTWAEWRERWKHQRKEPKRIAPVFRLTCGYIERATRLHFIDTYFGGWHIMMPDDASIQKFCDMAKIPDLAECLFQINLHVDDDGVRKVAASEPPRRSDNSSTSPVAASDVHEDAHLPPASRAAQIDNNVVPQPTSSTLCRPPLDGPASISTATHIHNSDPEALVPLAYLRDKKAFIEALRACKNITEINFYNRPLDPNTARRPVAENANNNAVAVGNHAAPINDAAPVNENATEGADVAAEVPDEDLLFDMSSSFTYGLALAEEAGLFPSWVMTLGEHHRRRLKCGLTGCAGLVKSKAALCKLEHLHLKFIQDWREPVKTAEEAGLRLGRQLLEGLSSMPVLKKLDLDFAHSDTSLPAWSIFSKGPALPALEELDLRDCNIGVHDWAEFVLKHLSTLTILNSDELHLYGGSKSNIGSVFDELSRAPRLEAFNQESLFIGKDEEVTFPSAIRWPFTHEAIDEGDCVGIYLTNTIRWREPELKEVLVQMAKHLGFVV